MSTDAGTWIHAVVRACQSSLLVASIFLIKYETRLSARVRIEKAVLREKKERVNGPGTCSRMADSMSGPCRAPVLKQSESSW